MNLLELQVLAVVSRIPNGNDAPSPEFALELAADSGPQPATTDTHSARPATADSSVNQPA
jgi:hypothetical protein